MIDNTQLPSVNTLTINRVHTLIQQASALRLKTSTLANGTTIVDAGIDCKGGIEAGRLIAEICLGGLGHVKLRAADLGNWLWYVDVYTLQPVIACLGSQYAGWSLSYSDSKEYFSALGSGPARAIGSKEALFQELGYKDKADSACLVIETDNIPPVAIADEVADMCGITADKLVLILTPTSSLAGSVQIVARVLETALHKAHTVGFDLSMIVDGAGSAPVCPPSKDFLTAMGRTNDAILFAGQVHLFVQSSDEEAEQLAQQLPSSTSKDYGKPFSKIFSDVKYDFYKIDPLLFSPAKVTVTALESGHSFHAGKINLALLDQSFSN